MLKYGHEILEEANMLGEKIAERRKQLGWSQGDLAQRLGVASTRISEFESGFKTDCNLSTAKRLARALGCSIDYLAGTWDPQEEPPEAARLLAGTRGRGRPRTRALATAGGQP